MRDLYRKALVSMIAAVFAAGVVVAQDTTAADQAFTRGMQALDDEEWSEAIKQFQDALRSDPRESSARKIGRRILGIGGSEYLPHVRIGQAYLGMGDCAKALAEWEVSEQQGAVKGSEDGLEIIEEGEEECGEKGFLTSAEFRSNFQRAEGTLKEAAQIDQEITSLGAGRPEIGGDPKTQYDRAKADLIGARAKLNAAQQTRLKQTMSEAVAAAESVRSSLARSRDAFERAVALAAPVTGPPTIAVPEVRPIEQPPRATAKSELQNLRIRATQAFAALDSRLTQTRASLAVRRAAAPITQQATVQMKSAQDKLTKAREQFNRAAGAEDLEAARSATTAVAEINAQLDGIAALVGGQELSQAIPEVLKAAAQAFFGGRYDEAVTALRNDALQLMPSLYRVHALTIRAASLFARYEYSNRRDESLRSYARQDVDATRRLDPAFQPNREAFSPKFMAFFAEGSTAAR